MIKVNQSELIGAKLDLAVAKIVNPYGIYAIEDDLVCWEQIPSSTACDSSGRKVLACSFRPSTEWFDGGPIIEKYWDDICYELNIKYPRESPENIDWYAQIKGKDFLVEAMRALVSI